MGAYCWASAAAFLAYPPLRSIMLHVAKSWTDKPGVLYAEFCYPALVQTLQPLLPSLEAYLVQASPLPDVLPDLWNRAGRGGRP